LSRTKKATKIDLNCTIRAGESPACFLRQTNAHIRIKYIAPLWSPQEWRAKREGIVTHLTKVNFLRGCRRLRQRPSGRTRTSSSSSSSPSFGRSLDDRSPVRESPLSRPLLFADASVRNDAREEDSRQPPSHAVAAPCEAASRHRVPPRLGSQSFLLLLLLLPLTSEPKRRPRQQSEGGRGKGRRLRRKRRRQR
jgi:hypothetical protein